MGGALGGGVDELFPSYCAEEIAAAIAAGWRVNSLADYCSRCGASCDATARTDRGCPFCVGHSVPWDRIVRLGPYSEPMDRWVRSMKFGRRWAWGRFFGAQLAQGIESAPRRPPRGGRAPCRCTRSAAGTAGYNQAQIIADAFADARGWTRVNLLRRTRHTQPQTAVPVSRRADNVRGSFAIKPIDLKGWDVWLIDDVKTTGSTLAACCRLLRDAGAERINIAVAAVADPRSAGFQGDLTPLPLWERVPRLAGAGEG